MSLFMNNRLIVSKQYHRVFWLSKYCIASILFRVCRLLELDRCRRFAGAIVEEAAEAEKASDAVMANVSDAVNVRVEPSEEAEVAGKLYKNCGGTILEQADGWTKLTSGELTGWTKDEFLLFGDEAEAMQQEVGSLKATVKTDALRVRKEASEDAGIYTVLALGESVTAVEEADGWVTVQVDEDTQGYVSADYVDCLLYTSPSPRDCS